MSALANQWKRLLEGLCADDVGLRAKILSHIAADAALSELQPLAESFPGGPGSAGDDSAGSKRARTNGGDGGADQPTEAAFNASAVRFRFQPAKDEQLRSTDLSHYDDPASDAVRGHVLGDKPEGTVAVDFDLLESFMRDSLVSYGVPEDEASVCADVLIAADKRGVDSHGIGRLKPIYIDRITAGILSPTSPMTIVSQTPTTAVVDGKPAGRDLPGVGLYIGPKCMQLAIDKAKANGIGMVVVRNSTHYGHAAYYGLMASADGCIGITGTNARPSIAPTYGVEPMMGTNPLVFGMPSSDEFDFCIDCATSVNQRGKIEKYARDGQPTPAGAVIDVDGNQLTDSKLILERMMEKKCALTPLGGAGDAMGGYKGFGYAATVEILCAALQGNKWGHDLADTFIDEKTGEKKRQPSELGHFFIAIDISKFCDVESFQDAAGSILQGFRDARKDPNYGGRIYTAGEPEHLAWRYRNAHGGCPVPRALQKQMEELRQAQESMQEKDAYKTMPWETQE